MASSDQPLTSSRVHLLLFFPRSVINDLREDKLHKRNFFDGHLIEVGHGKENEGVTNDYTALEPCKFATFGDS